MDILAAVFVEGIEQRQVPGPSTRIDLTGIMFSLVAPSPPPISLSPHLVVLVRCPPDERGPATLEVEFFDGAGVQVARSVQPVNVEPGRFGRLLVKGDLTYEDYGTIEAHCRIVAGGTEQPSGVVVPLTLLPAP
ncbi:MAG TPA: hypothetical protein VHS52_10485 [Acidimicrobiales bacterium]|jgi:hypothetical protein|nr:hypothetical protein [Acidimicrobiales bacterium]